MSLSSALTRIFESPAADALAGALVHFVWQGLLIGLLLWTALRLLDETMAGARYALSCAALLALLAAPILTWTMLSRDVAPVYVDDAGGSSPMSIDGAPGSTTGREVGIGRSAHSVMASPLSEYMPPPAQALLVQVWATGVFLLLIRLTGGWSYARLNVRRFGRPAAPVWQERFGRLKERMNVAGSVRLLTSSRPPGPHTLGWLRPVIVVPASAMTGLPVWHVEAILAHELAHVRRRDYLVSMLQSLVEALLFYHPAVWWVSRQIRVEREHCCDDTAASACTSVLDYAKALTALEAMRATSPAWAPAASGGNLSSRIYRLLGLSPRRRPAPPAINMAGAILLVVITGLAIASCSDLATTPSTGSGADVTDMELPPQQADLLERGDVGALIESLHQMRSSGGENALSIALSAYRRAASPDARKSIVHVLSYFFTDEADVQLGNIARRDPSAEVRYHALWAFSFRLSELGLRNPGELTHRDLPVLEARRARNRHYNVHMIPLFKTIAADGEEEPRVRGAAIRALTATEYSDVSFLEPLLESSDPLVRRSAIHALSRLGDLGFDVVAQALEADPDPGVRRSAIGGLQLTRNPRAVPILADVARTTDLTEERWAAVGALTQLEHRNVPGAKAALVDLEASGIPADVW
jgi:beta-lactamase regulating signal transducer with metallopeptidase domain